VSSRLGANEVGDPADGTREAGRALALHPLPDPGADGLLGAAYRTQGR